MLLLRILYHVTFALCAMIFLSGKHVLPTRVWILNVLCAPKVHSQKPDFLSGVVGRWNLGAILDLWKDVLKDDRGTVALVSSL